MGEDKSCSKLGLTGLLLSLSTFKFSASGHLL